MIDETDKQKIAQQRCSLIESCIEGIALERETMQDRRYDRTLILHNIRGYQSVLQDNLTWLNVNGFSASVTNDKLEVQGLEKEA